jgi:putative methyltransferase (TIGR04325 family)
MPKFLVLTLITVVFIALSNWRVSFDSLGKFDHLEAYESAELITERHPNGTPGTAPLPAKAALALVGPFPTWADAVAGAGSYDEPSILEQVARSVLAVRDGKAVYERDSVLFDRIQYAWATLAAVLWGASMAGGSLRVLDFGGSLGSTFFQNRRFLNQLREIRWGVVEQAAFVELGRRELQDDRLQFFATIAEAAQSLKPNIVLLSGSLQFMPEPAAVLAELRAIPSVDVIVLDRTTFWDGDHDLPVVETVPPDIYTASYPCWILSERNLLETMAGGWQLVEEFPALDSFPSPVPTRWKGLVFHRA